MDSLFVKSKFKFVPAPTNLFQDTAVTKEEQELKQRIACLSEMELQNVFESFNLKNNGLFPDLSFQDMNEVLKQFETYMLNK